MGTAAANQWGNGQAVRHTKRVAKAAGIAQGTAAKITAKPGRIIIETVEKAPPLDDMLSRFDPKRHGAEAMAFHPIGKEAL